MRVTLRYDREEKGKDVTGSEVRSSLGNSLSSFRRHQRGVIPTSRSTPCGPIGQKSSSRFPQKTGDFESIPSNPD